ncbi:unnamed protein product [marine sediment metagenome]|uniref:Uncharacterized protein n=1 Tax=marine sediment metagenome TaxID=412755 RepID=X0X3S7_9ZZZZ
MLWRKLAAKEVYKDYPQDIKDKIRELMGKKKLEMVFGVDNIKPALEADIIVVVPLGEIIFKIIREKHKPILFFTHKDSWIRDLTLFKQIKQLAPLLNKAYERN